MSTRGLLLTERSGERDVSFGRTFPLHQVAPVGNDDRPVLSHESALEGGDLLGTRLMDLRIEKHEHDVTCPYCTAELTVASSIETTVCPLCDNEFVIENGVAKKPTESQAPYSVEED